MHRVAERGGAWPIGVRVPAAPLTRLLPALLLAAAAGCGGGAGAPADPRAADGYAIVPDDATQGIQLTRRGAALLRWPPEAFVLGVVDAWDDGLNYDPWYLDAFDVRWFPGRTVAEIEPGRWRIEADEGVRADLTIAEVAPGEGWWRAHLLPEAPEGAFGAVAFVRLAPRVGPDERFYGLGSALDTPEHRGKVRAMQLEAAFGEVDSGYNEAHVPIPLLIGTSGWGLFVEEPRPGLFEVATPATGDDVVRVTFGLGAASGGGLLFHLYVAEHPLDVPRLYYRTTGFPLLPARWALGPWIWRDESDDQAQVVSDLETLRRLDLATSGYWIDRPYASGVNSFDFAPDRFPDPQAMVDRAHALGFRMALWHTPYLDPEEVPALHGQARERGFFPKTNSPVLNAWSLPLDLTNPDAVAWWQGLLRRYIDLGVEGFKLDYAEDVVPGFGQARVPWRFHDGSDELTMQSQYQRHYHRTYAELLPATGGFLLCRAGTYGDQTHVSVVWPGDLDANLARHRAPATDRRSGEEFPATGGLPASLALALSLGPSGYPFYGSDTGGYRHAPPDKETFVRWFEQTALSTVMQVGTNTNDVPWEFRADNGFDAESLDLYRRYARLHLRLFPYVWTYARRLAAGPDPDGRPIMRALGLAHPELRVHPSDVYLLGDDLLVAPVVTAGAATRTLDLPAGRWAAWPTGPEGDADAPAQVHEGPGAITVPAPLGVLPLFVREGALIPLLRPTVDTLAPRAADVPDVDSFATDGAGPLHARVFPSQTPTGFALYDGSRLSQRIEGAGVITVTWTPGDEFTGPAEVELIGVDATPSRLSVPAGGAATATLRRQR